MKQSELQNEQPTRVWCKNCDHGIENGMPLTSTFWMVQTCVVFSIWTLFFGDFGQRASSSVLGFLSWKCFATPDVWDYTMSHFPLLSNRCKSRNFKLNEKVRKIKGGGSNGFFILLYGTLTASDVVNLCGLTCRLTHTQTTTYLCVCRCECSDWLVKHKHVYQIKRVVRQPFPILLSALCMCVCVCV